MNCRLCSDNFAFWTNPVLRNISKDIIGEAQLLTLSKIARISIGEDFEGK
jgi:hypothetical protein